MENDIDIEICGNCKNFVRYYVLRTCGYRSIHRGYCKASPRFKEKNFTLSACEKYEKHDFQQEKEKSILKAKDIINKYEKSLSGLLAYIEKTSEECDN